MDRSGLSSLALAAFVVACSAPSFDGPPLTRPSSAVVESPAGPESSEPVLSASDGVAGALHLTWVGRGEGGVHELRMSSFDGSGWSRPAVVVRSARLFLHWADLPSVVHGRDGSLWAHWLERDERGGYGVRLARSPDGGASWSHPWTPHELGSSAEHGFVAAVPIGEEVGFAWLDGRALASSAPGTEEAATGLYFRLMGPGGPTGPESVIDPRACDCCQTDIAVAARGAVLAYRDRSAEEIRDIRVTTWQGGAWSEPRLVHEDGWETGACPVNGPAIDARGESVVVAWFTAAGGVPRVKVAFSDDSAERFHEPILVDDGDPAGRLDAVMLDDGSALVSWLERTEADGSEVRVRRVAPDGRKSESERVSAASGERVSGVSRMARSAEGRVWLAWTDATSTVPRVRVAVIDAPVIGGP